MSRPIPVLDETKEKAAVNMHSMFGFNLFILSLDKLNENNSECLLNPQLPTKPSWLCR